MWLHSHDLQAIFMTLIVHDVYLYIYMCFSFVFLLLLHASFYSSF